MGATSPHFSSEELACPHCNVNGMQQSGVDLAEDVRSLAESEYGLGRVRVDVHSAYRCPAHNAEIGGAPKSQHMQGLALDIALEVSLDIGGKGKVKWAALPPADMERIARKSKLLGGIGRDDARKFIHIDARPKTSALPSQWCYSGTKEVSYYPAVPAVQST